MWILIVILPIPYYCILNGDLTVEWKMEILCVGLGGGEGGESEGAYCIPIHVRRSLDAEKIVH